LVDSPSINDPNDPLRDAFCYNADMEDEHGYGISNYSSANRIVPDSGASRHCFSDITLFHEIKERHPKIQVRVANGKAVPVLAIGDVKLPLVDEKGHTHHVVLPDCLYVPTFACNLLSIKQLWKRNRIKTRFGERDFFRMPDGSKSFFDDGSNGHVAMHATHGLDDQILHKRYGHCGARRLRMASRVCVAPSELREYKGPGPGECDACEQGGKAKWRPRTYKFHKHNSNSSNTKRPSQKQFSYFGQRISSDLCEGFPPSVLGKFKYAICFVDACTGFAAVDFLHSKSSTEVLQALQNFQRRHKHWLPDGKVEEWHCDNGGEFTSSDIDDFCEEMAIKRSFSVPYTSNTNAKAERFWGLVLRPMRAIIADSKAPLSLWTYAMEHACRLHNCLPTVSLEGNISPYEAVSGKQPDLSKFRVWGARTWYKLPEKDVLSKIGDRSLESFNLGLDPLRPGYRIFCPKLGRFTTVPYNARVNEREFCTIDRSMVGTHELHEDDEAPPARVQGGDSADLQGGPKESIACIRGTHFFSTAIFQTNRVRFIYHGRLLVKIWLRFRSRDQHHL